MNVCEVAETGVDAIDGASLGNDFLDESARLFETRARSSCQRQAFFAARNRGNLRERESLAVKFEHESARKQKSEQSTDYGDYADKKLFISICGIGIIRGCSDLRLLTSESCLLVRCFRNMNPALRRLRDLNLADLGAARPLACAPGASHCRARA